MTTGRVEWNEIAATSYRIALTLSAGVATIGALNELAVRGSVGVLSLVPVVLIAAGAVTFGAWRTWARPLAAAAGGAAALVWLSVLPAVADEAILVPTFMTATCVAGAVWFSGWGIRRPGEPGSVQPAEGWIEEDGRRAEG